jgi:hypothetical protein
MTSRRRFLTVGLAAAALPLAARGNFRAEASSGETVALYKVLYDTRFAASVAFAHRASARGLTVQAMAGDMTQFWYGDLYHRWRSGPAAIAGLTAHGALFCLERLAWDQGMRVIYRGEHAAAAGGCVAHRFEGAALLLSAAPEPAPAPRWAAGFADVVAPSPIERTETRTRRASSRQTATGPSSEPLFSWVIAPMTRG